MLHQNNITFFTLLSNISLILKTISTSASNHNETEFSPGTYDIPQLNINVSYFAAEINNTATRNDTQKDYYYLGGHSVWQVVLIAFFSGAIALVTITGNMLVILAFKVNKQLKTVNNYFLLSLACADLIIGVISMNLFTTYIIMDRWAMGSIACDLWLMIDYVASNASVMNLLVISFDRFFSITRPLTYRTKRTTKRAGIMIGLAWAISFILWAPAILFWQYFVGKRTVPSDECFIQFLTEPIITFGTAIAAFYLPVSIMTILYWRIYRETEKRTKELAGLQASGGTADLAQGDRKKGKSKSNSNNKSQTNLKFSSRTRYRWYSFHSRSKLFKSVTKHINQDQSSNESWIHVDANTSLDNSATSDEEDVSENPKAIFPILLKLPRHNSVLGSKLPSVNQVKIPSATNKTSGTNPKEIKFKTMNIQKCMENRGMVANESRSIVLNSQVQQNVNVVTRTSAVQPISFKEIALAKRFAAKTRNQITKRKRMSLIKEKKAAQTLSAILLAFIVTWAPYNIMVLVNTFCESCIPRVYWNLGYWLCYINSTINPICYALCNKTFRTTFKTLLLCQSGKTKRRTKQYQLSKPIIYKNMPNESS